MHVRPFLTLHCILSRKRCTADLQERWLLPKSYPFQMYSRIRITRLHLACSQYQHLVRQKIEQNDMGVLELLLLPNMACSVENQDVL